MDERLLRPVVYDGQEETQLEGLELADVTNLALKLGSDRRLPFVVVAQNVYCVADRYQCRLGGKLADRDAYHYYCPNCQTRYQVTGQEFVDWCRFKEEGIIRR